MRVHLILHPGSREASIRRIRPVVAGMRKRGHTVFPRVLFERGDAARYAEEGIRCGAEVLLAVGGDGTVNEVANGIHRALAREGDATPARPRLGIVPLGTANDLAAALGIPHEVEAAVEVALHGRPRPIDVGRVNEYCFLNVSAGGFGAEASEESSPEVKAALGPLAYLVTGARKFATLEPSSARFLADRALYDGPFLIFAVGNSRRTGGGNQLTPRASLDDGLLDLCVVKDMPKVDLLRMLPELRAGEHLGHPRVGYWQVPELTIRGESQLSVNADGEPLSGNTFHYRVSPYRIEVMVPPDEPARSGAAGEEG